MAGTRQTAVKSKIKITMTDAAIKQRTGKDWAGWFAALDKAGGRPAGPQGHRQAGPRGYGCRRLVRPDDRGEL